jgi:hypothetical protein
LFLFLQGQIPFFEARQSLCYPEGAISWKKGKTRAQLREAALHVRIRPVPEVPEDLPIVHLMHRAGLIDVESDAHNKERLNQHAVQNLAQAATMAAAVANVGNELLQRNQPIITSDDRIVYPHSRKFEDEWNNPDFYYGAFPG